MSNVKTHSGSIRKKLLLWLLVPLVGLCSLSAFVAYSLSETFANQSYDLLLLKSAESIAGRVMRNEDGIVVADIPTAAQAILRHSAKDTFYYQIADSFGHRLTGDAVLPLPTDTTEGGPKFRQVTIDGHPVRMCRISVRISPSPDEIWIQVAETLDSRHRFLAQIFLSILIPQLVLVVLASLSVWLGVKNGLDPLERLGKLLKARGKLDLSPVDIGKTPAELAPVTKALNELFLSANDHIRLQRQFIGNAAHQLKTPLTAITTYVDYAERINETKEEDLDSVLKRMSEAATRVAHLVNRLLSLARSEEHGQKEFVIVDLNTAVNDAAANVIPEALRRGVKLDFELPEAPVNVRADRGDLSEMLTNLLDNAIKYTAENDGAVWVTVQDGDHVAFTVADNGAGIDDSEKAKIFERFYRIPGANGSGCGLGLAIVSEVADSNGLVVSVMDRPEGGTIFQVGFKSVSVV